MAYYAVIVSHTGELYHHGIKGQKWGVVNGPPYPLGKDQYSKSELRKMGSVKRSANKMQDNIKNITDYGWKRGHAMNVANNLHYNIRNDKERMGRLTSRQKQSLENAEKYWNARAKGEKTPHRNIIKREADAYRSMTLGQRGTIQLVRDGGMCATGQLPLYGIGLNAVANLAIDEVLVNYLFGHF